MDKTELLSKYLFDIHNYQLTPFYDGANALKYQDLDEKSNDNSEVDKTFYRIIAKDIIENFKTDPGFESQLPKILYEIHARSLPPYFLSFENYIIYQNDPEDGASKFNWATLEENVIDKNQVDKMFFRNIAKFIINAIKADT